MIKTKKNIKGYINNITNKTKYNIECIGIRNNNKLYFNYNNIKYNIEIDSSNNIVFKRESKEFIHYIKYIKNNKTTSEYTLKSKNIIITIDIYTYNIDINNNSLIINYKILESEEEYEYRIEVKDENESK